MSIKTCTIPRKRNRPFPSKRKWLLYLAIVLVLQLFKPSIYLKRCENKFELEYIQKKEYLKIYLKIFHQYTYLCDCANVIQQLLRYCLKECLFWSWKKPVLVHYISYIFLENMKWLRNLKQLYISSKNFNWLNKMFKNSVCVFKITTVWFPKSKNVLRPRKTCTQWCCNWGK